MLTSNPSTSPAHEPLSCQELATISGGLKTVLSQMAIRQFLTTAVTDPQIKSIEGLFAEARQNERSLATDPRHMLWRR